MFFWNQNCILTIIQPPIPPTHVPTFAQFPLSCLNHINVSSQADDDDDGDEDDDDVDDDLG